MRNPFTVLAEKLLTRHGDLEELARAKDEASSARARRQADEQLAREAEQVAEKLRAHRTSNHFADRMAAAYRGERHA